MTIYPEVMEAAYQAGMEQQLESSKSRLYPLCLIYLPPFQTSGYRCVSYISQKRQTLLVCVDQWIVLAGAFAYDDIHELEYYGCFRSDPATPALSKRVSARGVIHAGKGFATLQHCVRKCSRLKYAFAGMNGDGCFCGTDVPEKHGPLSLPTHACVDSGSINGQFNDIECGSGPCGQGATHMAMYHIKAVNVDPGGDGAAPGGGIRHSGPGNAFIEARVELATAFTAEWRLQGRGYGVDGRIEVLHKGEVVIAMDAPKGPDGFATGAPIEARAALFPGSYVVLLYGVYDAAAEEAARDGTAEPISIRFKEPKYCNLTDWSTLTQGPIDCNVPHLTAKVKVDHARSLAASPGDSSDDEEENPPIPAEEVEVDEATGEVMLMNPAEDGVYLDIHMGPVKMTLDPKAFLNFHFLLKGTFILFGFIIVIDITVKVGSAEEGGGIMFYFKFEWLMPGSNKQLALVAGNFDLIPLDFAALITFDIGALADTKLMLGLVIRPIVMNQVMEVITLNPGAQI